MLLAHIPFVAFGMVTEYLGYVFGYQFAKPSVILSGGHHWACSIESVSRNALK